MWDIKDFTVIANYYGGCMYYLNHVGYKIKQWLVTGDEGLGTGD